MPGRFIPTSSGILGSVLIVAGIGYIAIGIGWIVTSTAQRLAGIHWLGIAGQDKAIGALWIAIGALVVLCGAFSHHRRIETAGTILSTAWPGLLGIFFLIASVVYGHETGWITTISYSLFAAMITVVASHPRFNHGGDSAEQESEVRPNV